ncbi:predicted protein [Histoplasma mississippiense (nom. inval.)]|uniref:predicted protein n=1 Tax=Ajellomyces capsulatus (strain NAm1 / WU24) TaxID=2059318 RepID=UPI000157BA87|nr:predicted protein [Histoplasma mississippiense (nom. inval.)]EDN05779.1 predicted protein [Histoplasma mississippiense (nom. inval.)]
MSHTDKGYAGPMPVLWDETWQRQTKDGKLIESSSECSISFHKSIPTEPLQQEQGILTSGFITCSS